MKHVYHGSSQEHWLVVKPLNNSRPATFGPVRWKSPLVWSYSKAPTAAESGRSSQTPSMSPLGWSSERGLIERPGGAEQDIVALQYIEQEVKILIWASIQAGYRCTPIYEGRSSLMCLFCGHYPISPISRPPHASAKAFSYRSSKIWFCALMNRIPMPKVIFKWAKRTFSIPK